ncbi:MAG: hypothetical protein Q4D03_05415 [Bacteroidales bacterium]|nr:hypothetical protein [Bacteroidales bacterium]
MKYKRLNMIMLMLLAMITSCNFIGPDVYNIVKTNADQGVDTINFTDALWFDWDTMYWFPSNYPLEEINAIVNINNYWQDVGDRIVFVKDHKIVYYNEFFPYHETPLERIDFNTDSLMVVGSDDALFSIQKVGDKLYILSSIKK